jgi:hypothetical protein
VLFPKPPWLCNRKNPVLALLENLPTTVTFVKVFCTAQISETCFWMRSEIMEFFLTAICLSILLTALEQYSLVARYFGETRDKGNTFVASQSGLRCSRRLSCGNDSSYEDFYHVLRTCISCLKHIASPDRDTPFLSVT